MRGSSAATVLLCTALIVAGCQKAPERVERSGRAAEFGRTVEGLLLDTTAFELRGILWRKVINPNRDDESPLADSVVGRARPISVEGDRVFVDSPPVLIFGHRHGDKLFVPVKLFARQYGAYVDIGCTPANCASIWTADSLAYMRANGASGAAGVLGAHAEGLIDSIDVRKLPRG